MSIAQAGDCLYDVVAIDVETSIVRVIGTSSRFLKPTAEVLVAMSGMGYAAGAEFFSEVPVGAYMDGDKWHGRTGVEL